MERELQDEVILDLPALLALCLRKGIWILLVTVLCGLALPSVKPKGGEPKDGRREWRC